jgi:hypothetical protein
MFTLIKDIIAVVLPTLTLILGVGFVYWRENKKLFQEKIFEFKLNAYKEILEETGLFYDEIFAFLELLQDYEKSEDEWNIDAQEHFKNYYKKAFGLKRLYYKNIALLPEEPLAELNQLISRCISHVTMHSHIKTDLPHDSYENLYEKIMDFAELARKDLSINLLNSSLNNRLVLDFYPINLPKQPPGYIEGTDYTE